MFLSSYVRKDKSVLFLKGWKSGEKKLPRIVRNKPVKFISDVTLRMIPQERIEQALQYAKTSLAIEGQSISNESEELIMKRLRREITHSEFVRLALQIATK